jgi:dTDP-glucose pyrophosphorylase
MSLLSPKISNLVILNICSVRDAMAAINANGREVVLVQDETSKIAGLVTDGDIRRGLLAGRDLNSQVHEVMRRDFFFVGPKEDRAAVLDIMKARLFQHVPVLDGEGRLLGVHFLTDLIGAIAKPNIAVIMAGGKGTRLRPITETIPKPMVEVAGRPILERIILHLVSHGIRNIFLSVNYMAEHIERHFGDGKALGCKISYLREDKPLGTGGALSLLPDSLSHPILVLNGDQITGVDVTALLESHDRCGAVATVGIGTYQIQVPFGVIEQSDGRLRGIEEKPTLTVTINRGLYVLSPEVIRNVPLGVEYPITNLFDVLLAKGSHVGVFHFDDYWLDVGSIAELREAGGYRGSIVKAQ